MKKIFILWMFAVLMTLAGVTACGNEDNIVISDDADPEELLKGEWWLVGWNDGGTWFEVDTNYVCHHCLSIEFKEDGNVMAWSMVNDITVGMLTLNGKEMTWDTTWRGSTMVGCSVMENNFFEKYIYGIKSYQLKGKELRLYYTDNDYFVFTKDYDDSEEYKYAWKNGLPDRYIGEVTVVNDDEVIVKILDYPQYAWSYARSCPPSDNSHLCHIAKSNLLGLSMEVGDKIAFRIDKFRSLKDSSREYQCVVTPYESSERVDDVMGLVYNDQLFRGWCIMIPSNNEKSTATYYLPMKPLPEAYLTENQPVLISGTLYQTWNHVSNFAHPEEAQYYVNIDKLEKRTAEDVSSKWLLSPAEEGDVYAVLYDYFQNKYPSVPMSYQFFRNSEGDKTKLYNSSDEILLGKKAEFPEIDLSKYTLVVGQAVMSKGFYSVERQEMVPCVTGWQLNLYVKEAEGNQSSTQYLFYWGLYPKKEYYKITANVVKLSTQ